MKIKKYLSIIALGALALAGCTKDYNDHFEGLEEKTEITDVQRGLEYELAAADYKTIAENKTNVALAEADENDPTAALEALAAISTNKSFANADEAAKYLPAFLSSQSKWYHLSPNSQILVSSKLAVDVPAAYAAMNAMKSYTLTADDYKAAWGSDETYVEALTPATVSKLGEVLSLDDVEEGEYVAVTYKYAASEPSFGGEAEEPGVEEGYTDVLGKAALNEKVTVRGYVVAASSQGVVVADKGGAILLYQTTDYEVGDEVTFEGTIGHYNTGFQVAKDALTSIEKTGTTSVAYPEPVELTGELMDEILVRTDDAYQIFVKVTAKVSAGSYYNFYVDGAESATGSFYGLTDAQKELLKDGETITFYGYLSSVSKSKDVPTYVNVIATHINETPVIDNGYTNVLGTAALNEEVEVVGYVVAASSQGVVVADNGGAILLYQTTDYAVGDVVALTGKIGHYNTGFQIAKDALTSIEKRGTTTVVYPEPVELTGELMDEILVRTDDAYQIFVKVTAKVSAGSYYNFYVDGAEAATGSFYGLTNEQKELLKDGETITFYGYLSSVSKSKDVPTYVNVIATHINETPVIDNGYTNVLGTAALNEEVEVVGYVVAASSQGVVVADNGGAILLYQTTDYAVGDVVALTGKIGHYNTGFQIAKDALTSIEKTGTTTVVYPEPVELTGELMDEILVRTDDAYQIFVKVTAKVSAGSYYNFYVDGAESATGSFYGLTNEQKELLKDGETITFYGYLSSVSKSKDVPTYVNVIATHIGEAPAAAATYSAAALGAVTRAAAPATVNMYAVYLYDGEKFSAADAAVVQPADYTAMGQNYGNFTDPTQDTYLPKYLTSTYPYAMEGDVKAVVYRKYANSTTSWAADEYTFDGSNWVKTEYFTTLISAFRKVDGKNWAYDPTLEIDFSVMGDADFKAFCQYCANWVYDNIEVPLGAPARDNAGVILENTAVKVNGANLTEYCFFDNRGNAEYWAGTYAYYGEMAWNTNYAMDDFKKAAEIIKEKGLDVDLGISVDDVLGGASGADIVKAMQNNAGKVFGEVLGLLYPDVTPEDYSKCVVKVYNYTNRAEDGVTPGVYQCTLNVTGTGKFEFVKDSFERAE